MSIKNSENTSLTKKECSYLLGYGIHPSWTPDFQKLYNELVDLYGDSNSDLSLKDLNFERDGDKIRKELEEEFENVIKDRLDDIEEAKKVRPETLDEKFPI